jgi:CHAT domain
MKEMFLKFRESSYSSEGALPMNSDPNSSSQYTVDFLLACNMRELFSDSLKNKYEPLSIDGRLMKGRLSEDPRPLLLDCLSSEVRTAVTEAKEPTRLRIVSGVPAIDAIAWEALDGIGSGGGAVGVTRCVPVLLPPPPLSVSLPIKILVVATSPPDERLLDSYREIDAITSKIDRQKYVVQILSPATREEAAATIRNFQPHVFHYVGHSGVVRGAGALVLHEPSLGTTDWIGAAEIAQMLPISTRLVCLSTCFTQINYNVRGLSLLAHAPQSIKLPTCVANRTEVTESDVRTFWSTFYGSLVATLGNVEEAFFSAQASPTGPALFGRSFSLVTRDAGAHPLRIGSAVDPARFAEEVQAQFASRLAAELNEKLKSFGAEAPKTLIDSFSDAQSSFSDIASRAAKWNE